MSDKAVAVDTAFISNVPQQPVLCGRKIENRIITPTICGGVLFLSKNVRRRDFYPLTDGVKGNGLDGCALTGKSGDSDSKSPFYGKPLTKIENLYFYLY